MTKEIQRVGRLTLSDEQAPAGLLIARCDCGYPCVLLPERRWGLVYGCPACHAAEQQRQAKEAQYQAEQTAAQERHEARQQRQYDINVLPHWEELSARHRRLFKRMSEAPGGMTVQQVSALTGLNWRDAWQEVLAIIEANCLLERNGPFGEVRPYTPDEPYSLRVHPENTFQCRRAAVRQMEEAEEAAASAAAARLRAPVQVPAPPVAPTTDILADEVRQFVQDRCIQGEGEHASDVLLRVRYCAWAEERGLEPLSVDQFTAALEHAGFRASGGKRRGLRLKLLREMEAEQPAGAEGVKHFV